MGIHQKMQIKIVAVVVLGVLSFTTIISAQESVDFNRDVRPILSDKCYHCHGPDAESREASLRLDVAADAHVGAFVPGNLDDSEAWRRILSEDKDEIMPPPESHKQLDEAEKEIIQRWIVAGAKYERHWSFRKIEAPSVPAVQEPRFSKSAIDAFVFQAMTSHGLKPSARATKAALIRRVTLDLTGLPPTMAEVDAFIADSSSNAFEKVVDRLLASPKFGERMAVDWMDIARYGDTSVFHADGPRDMWRWRDWVVDAYNKNMPYNEFTIKQLAGDLLPDKSVEDHLASGFNRNNASTDEGGAIAEEFRVEYAVDRVKTTSMVWMGLSMECAQCHDHKYDPISQEDYYRFFAFFNRASDPGMQSRRGNQAPVVNILDEEKLAKVPGLEKQIAATVSELKQLTEAAKSGFDEWVVRDDLADQTEGIPGDTSTWFTFDQGEASELINESMPNDKVSLNGNAKLVEGKFGKAIRTNNKQFLRSKLAAKDFAGDTPISYGCWVKLNGNPNGAPIARMDEGQAHIGFDLYLQGDGVAAHLIHAWPSDAIKVIAKTKLKKNQWYHLFVTYDGSKKSSGFKIYVDGKHVESSPSHDSLKGSTKSPAPFTVGRRKNSSQFDGWVDDVRIYHRELSSAEVATVADADPLPGLLAVAKKDRNDQQNQQLFEIYLQREVPQAAKLKQEIAAFKAKIAELKKPVTTVMVMQDQPKPRMTYVLDRGQYDSPNKEKPVDVGVPDFLPEFGDAYEQNRLGMAKWLTSPQHPLTARVTVNRYWRMFFGTGIVQSVEDFGLQGAWPSHPELLDWLASDFIGNGWDTKRLIKMMVMSEAYQQSSVVTEEQLSLDPGNRYLSRGPRFRLSGEFLRDQVLYLSGLMNEAMGGPGVKPYQPDGLWNEVSLNKGLRFKRDSGTKLYRRSLYTYWKRSSPPPSMVIFDAPTREKCTVRRGNTNTPLQALVLMNDPQFVEAARFFAERIMREGGNTIEEKIKFAFRLTTSRQPSEQELDVLKQIYQQELENYQAKADQAEQLLKVGEKQRDSSLDLAEHAAWTLISNLLFNLDEFVTRG